MDIHEIIRTSGEGPPGPAEHIRYAQCKLREAAHGPGRETLRCAQGDSGGREGGTKRQTLRFRSG